MLIAAKLPIRAKLPVITPIAHSVSRRHLVWGTVVAMSTAGEYTYKYVIASATLWLPKSSCEGLSGANTSYFCGKRPAIVHKSSSQDYLKCSTCNSRRIWWSNNHGCRYPRPGMTVDACIVAKQPAKLLLIQRQKAPCKVSSIALPAVIEKSSGYMLVSCGTVWEVAACHRLLELLYPQSLSFCGACNQPRGLVAACMSVLVRTHADL